MKLQRRAKAYARILSIIFASQKLSGSIRLATRGARHISLGVALNDPAQLSKTLALGESIALASNVRNIRASRIMGLVVFQYQLGQGFWEFYERADLPSPKAVGLGEQRKPVIFELDPPHALIAGTSGSGKSEIIKSILVALANTHTPQELGLVICDPDRDYDDFRNLAHLMAPIANSAEEIQKSLMWMNEELKRRKAENLKTGQIIVLAIDEAENDVVLGNEKSLAILQAIATARKYRLHILLGTQKPTHKKLPKVLDNLGNKFVGKVTSASISATVTGYAGLEAHKLIGKGDFLHIAGAETTRFQVAQATPADFNKLERAEIKPVEIQSEIIEPLPAAKPVGRPVLKVEPGRAAYYYYKGPDNISIARARKVFGLSRDGHNLHKQFILDFARAYQELRKL